MSKQKYGSNAERQQAYRERCRVKREQAIDSVMYIIDLEWSFAFGGVGQANPEWWELVQECRHEWCARVFEKRNPHRRDINRWELMESLRRLDSEGVDSAA